MVDKRPGLVIRRRKRDDESNDDTAADANATEQAATESDDGARTGADTAGHLAASAAPAPKPASSTATQTGHAVATPDTGRGEVWRAPVAPRIAEPERSGDDIPVADEGPLPTTDDFAAMLGDAQVAVTTWAAGDKVDATVVGIDQHYVFVNLGAKSEGVIERGELVDPDGELTVDLGDRIEAWVVRVGSDGIQLSTALGRSGNDASDMIAQAASDQIPVEGKVTGTNKGGYDVDVLGTRAFCPFSQIDLNAGEPEDYVGKTLTFVVTRIDESGRNVVVSRAALQREERERAAAKTMQELQVDDVVDGVVTRLAEFGAFVDIGGVDGLVHVSELSWSRVEDPSELVRVGDAVRVRVLRIDHGDERGPRISLSMRALQEDPWVATVASLHVGATTSGTVTRLEKFGAFVEIAPAVEGLVHISEISPGRRINHPREVLEVGQQVEVQVLSTDPKKRQIGLSIKALMDDPWAAAAQHLRPGTAVQGTVENVQSFGVFVEIAGGITGLVPMSQLPDEEKDAVHVKFRPGNEIEARVLDIDTGRRRLTLSRLAGDDAARGDFDDWRKQSDDNAGLGTFADLLKNRK